jgi:RNA polymerase sigma-70 factor (ECF subfamily)
MAQPDPGPAVARAPHGAQVEALYREHFAFVWRTARRMSIAEANADDVVQDTFLVVHRRLAEFDDRMSVRGWLYGIVAHVVLYKKRRARRKDAPVSSMEEDPRGADQFAARDATPAAAAEIAESWALLDRLLAQLPPESSEVLILSKLEGMSVPEIAECVGANVNTVYSRLRAASQRLEALYGEFLAEEERRARS